MTIWRSFDESRKPAPSVRLRLFRTTHRFFFLFFVFWFVCFFFFFFFVVFVPLERGDFFSILDCEHCDFLFFFPSDSGVSRRFAISRYRRTKYASRLNRLGLKMSSLPFSSSHHNRPSDSFPLAGMLFLSDRPSADRIERPSSLPSLAPGCERASCPPQVLLLYFPKLNPSASPGPAFCFDREGVSSSVCSAGGSRWYFDVAFGRFPSPGPSVSPLVRWLVCPRLTDGPLFSVLNCFFFRDAQIFFFPPKRVASVPRS